MFYVAFLCLRGHKTYVNRRQTANKMYMYVHMVELLNLKSALDIYAMRLSRGLCNSRFLRKGTC